jgi:hypothetical protein
MENLIMRHVPMVLAAAIGFLMLPGAREAQAQPGGYMGGSPAPYYPYGTQRVSPYVGMLMGTNTSAGLVANYYQGVRSPIQLGYGQQVQTGQLRNLQGEINGLAASEEEFPTLKATGHMTAFNATGSYFGGSNSSYLMQMRFRQMMMRQFPAQRSAGPVK